MDRLPARAANPSLNARPAMKPMKPMNPTNSMKHALARTAVLLAALAAAASALAQAPAPAAPAAPAKPATPPPAAPAPAGAAFKEVAFDGAKPAAAELFRKHLDATGGEAAWATKSAIRSKGAIEIPSAGLKGSMTLVAMEPDRMLVTMDLPGMGETRTGSDGTTGWSIDPMRGPALMDAKQLADIKRDANFRRDLMLAKDAGNAEVVGLFEFEGAPCWRVKVTGAGSAKETHHFYSKESGLLTGMSMRMATPMGEIPAVIAVGDYKDFGDVKLPAKTVTKVMGQQQVMTTDTVDWGGVDEKVFELPAEIKALKSAPAAPAAPAAAPAAK